MKILIILTSHATIGDTGRATGVRLEELSTLIRIRWMLTAGIPPA
jgi:hypothetical protein